MTRYPFVWEVQVRREVLDSELGHLREVPYSLWKHVVSAPLTKLVTARDNRPYTVTVWAEYLSRDSEDIRVTLSLARARGLGRTLISQTFVITPENQVRV